MLTGSDLLAKVKDLGDVSKTDLARSCGYVSAKKDGGERVNFTAFYEALLEAKGVVLSTGGTAGIGKGGRKLSYKLSSRATATCLSARPTPQCWTSTPVTNLKSLGKKAIRLVPVGGSDEENDLLSIT